MAQQPQPTHRGGRAGEPDKTLVSGEVNTPSIVKVNDETVTPSPATEFAIEKEWPVGPVEFTIEAINAVNVSETNTYTHEVPPERTFAYDLNGNMVSDGERTYEWDAEPWCLGSTAVDLPEANPKGDKPPGRRWSQNRLIAINYDEENENRTEFEYDGFGRRVRILELNDETVQSDKWFVWDGMQIAEQRASDGEIVEKRYFPQGFREGNDNYYYAKDHLGSIRAVVDAAGTERGRWDYDEWGVRGENGIVTNAVEPDFSYTGHYHHEHSGLVMAPFRAYWPEIGRWLSREPLERITGEMAELLPEGPNLYAYVANNPVNFTDPLGLYAPPNMFCSPDNQPVFGTAEFNNKYPCANTKILQAHGRVLLGTLKGSALGLGLDILNQNAPNPTGRNKTKLFGGPKSGDRTSWTRRFFGRPYGRALGRGPWGAMIGAALGAGSSFIEEASNIDTNCD